MRIIILTSLFILFSNLSFSQNLSETDRIRIAEAFRLSDKLSEKIWKDWKKSPFGVLLISPDHEFLINHQSPSIDFKEIGNDKLLKSNILWRPRSLNPSFLATYPAVGGISTIVVGQAENTWVKTSTPWTVTILHEHFHQFQNSQPNYYAAVDSLDLSNGDLSGMWMLNYSFPYSDKNVQEKFRQLCKMLAEILQDPSRKTSKEKLTKYLLVRKDFQESLKEKDYRYLSFQAWQEGVARYTEYKIAELAANGYKPSREFIKLKDFKPYKTVADDIYKNIIDELKNANLEESQRNVFYPFGAGEALLLDKVNAKWKSRYNTERFYLEKYFEK